MNRHLFFIGIVGHAMRGLALAAKNQGNTVTGLDETADEGVGSQWLRDHGIDWTRTPDPKLLDGVDLVIISGGTAADYPLLVEAKKRDIQIQSFAEYLGEVTKDELSVVVSGTHGKTTTTSLITWLFESAGKHPDYLIGIRPFNFDSSARLDNSKVVVLEGDEYVASNLDRRAKVLYYHPNVLVLTAIEHDHPDVYPDLKSVVDVFTKVVKTLPQDGRLVACAEGPNVLGVAQNAPCPVITYGLNEGDYVARDVAYLPTGIEFDVETHGGLVGRVAVPLYGKHMVQNALAATVVGLTEGLSIDQVIEGAASFKGAYRRFNIVSYKDSAITIVDDYGHHPTEAAVNIEAAKLHFPGRRIVVVYRPHTYSRTAALLPEYQQAFNQADLVYITDIEGARETGMESTVSGNDIVKALKMPAHYAPDRAKLVEQLQADTKPGDVVLCFTVSGYENFAQELAQKTKPATHET
jgi:UDP-N-acetylmuramate--L-alanine ligase